MNKNSYVAVILFFLESLPSTDFPEIFRKFQFNSSLWKLEVFNFAEVEKKLASGEKDTRLTRTSARKSRLTDSFFDAKERLEDAREAAASSRASPMATRTNRPRAYLRPALDPENTVMVFPDDDLTPMGIEVTGVQDDPSSTNGRLSAVQILRIEPDGRVGMDGRLKVGDNIIEIDSRPVYQMSIVRARAYLSELQSRSEPSLTIARPPSSFTDPVDPLSRNQPTTSSLQNRPILSALQQANTQHIGHTKIVELRKTPAGFGFTVTGRETAKGERLFYIGTVKPNGVALGHLRAGDRLLEVEILIFLSTFWCRCTKCCLLKINGEPTAELTQAQVVDRLKKAGVGEAVTFLVSRVVPQEEEDEKKSSSSERENRPPTPTAAVAKRESEDSKVLHGGAAHKDGRLRVNDRIVGIEELRLDGESNATASEAVSRRLKAIGPTAKHVRLFIQRARTFEGRRSASQPQEVSRVSVDSEGPSRISVVATESTSSEEKPSPVDGLDSDYARLDESEMANVSDPFSREAPTRKSMSEKRGMGASNDPHHIKLFQDIKHQRQTSAPLSAMTTSLSFHGQTTGRSASQRAAARARSQSVHPRAPAPPKIMKMTPAPAPVPPQQHHSAPAASEKRRSQSVESISQDSRATPKTKRAAMPYRGALTSDSFRQATDFYSETVYGQTAPQPPPHPFPPGSPVMVKQRSASREKDKQRRKSLGGLNVMKSFLGFGGGKSREESPSQKTDTKAEEAQRLREEEEKKRIREHYERLREKEAEANRHPHSLTPGTLFYFIFRKWLFFMLE
ncbi:PDZ/DHR/GLGF domain protein [Ancylostoma ceylanicum]|uniref:PDZ/DHR/GLGF domain protein n=1 Tax=Ancylostoma ceylanicum TaxID=53326 RepID=A0A0D6M8C7_9BILA|nr:PDZ/DHR/GLGF domain protein [Ancylostoma ceylanicum]